eukprot:g3960.t1
MARRRHPTFLLPAEPPFSEKESRSISYRKRLQTFNQQVVCDFNNLPYVVYAFVAIKLSVHCFLFQKLVRDQDAPLFGEDNLKRFLLYNVALDSLGFGATNGPLGFRFKIPFVTWFNLLMPGSITCPLLPGIAHKRKVWQCLGFVVYIYFIVQALRSPTEIGYRELMPIVATLALLTPFDFVTFQAARGEHSGYLLFCLLMPTRQLRYLGMRLVQGCLWSFAGTAKAGPWMKHVNGFMLPHSKFLAAANACGVPVAKHLFKDIPKDVSPSDTLRGLAIFGCVGEIMLGPLNLFFPAIGVPLAISLHIFILSMTPFASVMEWNVLCIYLSVALFSSGSSESGFGGYSMAELRTGFAEMPALHQCLLPLLLFLIPVFGQLYPKLVPFLAAYRPYAGNWRFSWHIVDAKAKHKLRKLRTLESIFVSENAGFLMGSDSWYLEDFASGSMITFPHFRPLVPIVEWLEKRMGWKHSDDYLTLYNEIFLNAACGWCLGTGFYVKPGFHDALRETCGFEEGEMCC